MINYKDLLNPVKIKIDEIREKYKNDLRYKSEIEFALDEIEDLFWVQRTSKPKKRLSDTLMLNLAWSVYEHLNKKTREIEELNKDFN